MATLTRVRVPGNHWVSRLPRLDARLVVGVLLVCVSVIGGLRLVGAADNTHPVLVANRDLGANHQLTPGDVRVARVHVSDEVMGRLIPAARPLTGMVLLFPLAEGSLLAPSQLATKPRAGREITVPVTPEHALGGIVRPGDRIDLIATFDKGTVDARTLVVAHDAEITEVVRESGLFGQQEGALSALTVSVSDDDAIVIAFAIRNGEIDVARSTGTNSTGRARVDASELP